MTPPRRNTGVPRSAAGQRPLGGRDRPLARDLAADPDADGVALAAATATGVFLGPRFAGTAAWVAAACCLAVACLGAAGGPFRLREEGDTPADVERRAQFVDRYGRIEHRVGGNVESPGE